MRIFFYTLFLALTLSLGMWFASEMWVHADHLMEQWNIHTAVWGTLFMAVCIAAPLGLGIGTMVDCIGRKYESN